MGINCSYMLYFKKDRLSDVLQGAAEMVEPGDPPIRIRFPDHVLTIPLRSSFQGVQELDYDDPEFRFDNAILFDVDESIRLWWDSGTKIEDSFRSPPGGSGVNQVPVGGIDLNVYNDLSIFAPDIELDLKDLFLFHFTAFISRISAMFLDSITIRKRFTEFLQKYDGVCGIFDDEHKGEVFWLNGKETSGFIKDVWISPEEIEQQLSKG